MLVVLALAYLSARMRSKGNFVSEYFLGSRGLGVWALALTFAATAASGGTFVGFPALIYTHGWILALWIAGYMMVPIVGMGLFGKRLNQVSQRAKALTLPEVLANRLASPIAGAVATVLITFFMFCYLLAQFKAGSKILATLLIDVPAFQNLVAWLHAAKAPLSFFVGVEADYLLCLTLFAIVVIAYVVYGGFRAVVWTDVMQGIIMVLGVIIMLVLVLHQTGGLTKSNQRLATMTPPDFGTITITQDNTQTADVFPKGAWLLTEDGEVIRLAEPHTPSNTAGVKALILTTPWEIAQVREHIAESQPKAHITSRQPYAYGAGKKGVYLGGPGPDSDSKLGYLSLTLAFSFFIFWAFGTAGQPSNMVRLMAFQKTHTLRYAIVTVALYFSAIYFTLVVIFCCGRTLLPGMEIDPDRTMPQLATTLTANAGVPWLAGLLLAAPFAAVMSSVDSFLLVASSSLVRDLYQKFIRPDADEQRLKRLSYLATALIGIAAFAASLRPPEYLQGIIVFASGGVAAAFLVPMIGVLFWSRLNAPGLIAGMMCGTLTHLALYLYEHFREPVPLNPFVWDQFGAGFAMVLVTLATEKPTTSLVETYFGETTAAKVESNQ